MTRIKLRPAVLEDAEMVFNWRNDAFIVSLSFSQHTVRWDEHIKWFGETISGNTRKMFIIQNGDQPIGQVRYDRLDEVNCIISVYLLQEFTGKGYGVKAIRYGCSEIIELWGFQNTIACVRSDNLRARSAFVKAGFVENKKPKYCPYGQFELIFTTKGDSG
jgi:RimJ/RimL family protein N-acetyltransferase